MDPISDMLIKIKNGSLAKKESVVTPHSKLKFSVASALLKAGFISGVSRKTKKSKPMLEILIAYDKEGTPKVHDIKRISKPGLRIYVKRKKVPSVLRGRGLAIISTSKGIITDQEAKKNGSGGEIMGYIW